MVAAKPPGPTPRRGCSAKTVRQARSWSARRGLMSRRSCESDSMKETARRTPYGSSSWCRSYSRNADPAARSATQVQTRQRRGDVSMTISQIGRASCRERVEFPVVADLLEKKQLCGRQHTYHHYRIQRSANVTRYSLLHAG